MDEYGWPTKTKARLVARGELFAPTVAVPCVRLLAAMACELGLDLCDFDVEQAFVLSPLTEDVCMQLPEGCG